MASKATSFRSAIARARAGKNDVDALVDAIPLALLILDRELRIESVSRCYCETFRVEPEDALACSVYEVGLGQWSTAEVRELLDGALLGHSRGSVDVERDFPGLGSRIMRAHARSLAHLPGEARVVFAVEDVTESVRRFRETPAQTYTAEFLAQLSHELRGPLASIANWLHLLSTGSPDAALQKQGLAAIDQALKAQTRLLDALTAADKK